MPSRPSQQQAAQLKPLANSGQDGKKQISREANRIIITHLPFSSLMVSAFLLSHTNRALDASFDLI